jgi:hypothetical protein
MATKAERYKYRQQRSGPKKAKSPQRPRRDTPIDTARTGVSATARKAGAGSTAARNRSLRAERKGGAVLEDSATDRPSRKSTRRSAGRMKRETNLVLRGARSTGAPRARASRAKPARAKRSARAARKER